MRTNLALATYVFIGLIDLAIGLVYLTADQFLSYHSEAVGASWQVVDVSTQTLILALMKVAGGGWIALGFLTIAFALGSINTNSVLARWSLPIGTVIFYLATIAATWSVYQTTGAQTPWAWCLGVVVAAMIALIVDAPWSCRIKS